MPKRSQVGSYIGSETHVILKWPKSQKVLFSSRISLFLNVRRLLDLSQFALFTYVGYRLLRSVPGGWILGGLSINNLSISTSECGPEFHLELAVEMYNAFLVFAAFQMLETVTSIKGTAKKAATSAYSVAGKTGTSHKVGNNGYEDGKYISLFAGLAPVDNPHIVVVVVVDDLVACVLLLLDVVVELLHVALHLHLDRC